MAHRALTLKYRPQVFADLIGQDHVSSVLTRALENQRVAHAYLFTGARGVGKTTSARILAKALNCEKRRAERAAGKLKTADPCNECTSCLEITSGASLDVSEIDGASNRGIADVQALREKVRFAPTGGGYRVVIIDEVHQLSGDAFAALLKTLEEPPAHLVFIFATTDPQKLPDTIRSRTQRFDFARVPLRKVADRLLEIQKREAADKEGVKFTLTEDAALLIAHKSEGSMRDAVSALDQVISAGEAEVDEELVRRVLGIADRESFFALGDAIVRRDPKSALLALHAAFDKGLDPRELAEGLSEHVRHMLILKIDPEGGDLVALARHDLERLVEQGKGWSESDLLRLLRLASEAALPMRDSPQPLIHLEAAVLQMATLEPGETLATLLERLDALEQRLGGSGGAPPRGSASGGGGSATPPSRMSTPPAPSRVAPVAPTRGAPPTRGFGPGAGGSGPPRASFAPATPAVVAPAPAFVATTPAPVASAATASSATAASATAVAEETELSPELEARWKDVLTGINGRKRMLGAFLEACRFVGTGGNAVIVAMDDLHRVVVEEQENRALIGEEIRRAFGDAHALRCVSGAAAAARPSAQDVKPLVDQAIAWFDGEVIERTKREAAPE
jgi:DNA polymerase-3 subunit gamma/tau